MLDVQVNEEEKSTTVVVPDYQLSFAIGKRGQNARLAAKLTGWKIDIKSETDARELGIYPSESSQLINLKLKMKTNHHSEVAYDLYQDDEE